MLLILTEFLVLAAIVVACGIALAHCADQIAEITGLGRVLIGSILLAGATSLPELTVDIAAVRLDMPNLACGDLLGSSLMNLLILAVCDLSFHSRGKMLSREAAGHALSGVMSIVLAAMVGFAILTSRHFPSLVMGGISLASIGILAAYAMGVRLVFLDQRLSAATVVPEDRKPLPPLWKPAAGFLAAAMIIMVTGPRLADSAGRFADASGLGKTFVGTSLVALSTSLPELVSSIAALRLKAFDLVIGNIFGSNTFNMILFAPLDFVYEGPLYSALTPAHVITCLATIVATCIAIMGQIYRVEGRRTPLLEPDAWLMILVIAGAMFVVYRLG